LQVASSPLSIQRPTLNNTPTKQHPTKQQIERVAQRLAASRKMKLVLTEPALEHIAQQGFEPMYGARPVKRAVTQLLETPIARAILAEEFVSEDTIEVDYDDKAGRLVLKKGPKVSQASVDGFAVATGR